MKKQGRQPKFTTIEDGEKIINENKAKLADLIANRRALVKSDQDKIDNLKKVIRTDELKLTKLRFRLANRMCV